MSHLLAPTSQVLRDIRNRELAAELRRRHAMSAPRVNHAGVSMFVNNMLTDVSEFRCVGRKLVSKDWPGIFNQTRRAVGGEQSLREEAVFGEAASRLLHHRLKSKKKSDDPNTDGVGESDSKSTRAASKATAVN